MNKILNVQWCSNISLDPQALSPHQLPVFSQNVTTLIQHTDAWRNSLMGTADMPLKTDTVKQSPDLWHRLKTVYFPFMFKFKMQMSCQAWGFGKQWTQYGGVSSILNSSVHCWYIQQKFTCVLTTNQPSYKHLVVLGFLFHFENFFKIFFWKDIQQKESCHLLVSKVLFLLLDLCTCVSFIYHPTIPRTSSARLKRSEQGMPLRYSLFCGKFLALTLKYDLSDHQAALSMILARLRNLIIPTLLILLMRNG
jgi:hypothetical protein